MEKKTILIIDDDPSVCASMALILEPDYRAIISNNAIDGLEQLKKVPEILLVLLDIRMPIMDGFTALPEIKKIRPDVKISIVTAGRPDTIQEKIEEMGVHDYIIKPFGVQDFLSRIEQLIGAPE